MASKKPLSSEAQKRVKQFSSKKDLRAVREALRKKDNRIASIAASVALVLALGSQFGYSALHPDVSASPSPTESNVGPVPDAALSESRTWSGTLKLNNQALKIELDGKAAPQAVASFVSLSQNGFFEGIKCHRLTTSGIFVLQCGSPKGDGSDGPGYSFGPIENAPSDNIYKTGLLAMARQGGKAYSMGSQFFIVYKDSPIPADAVGGYTVFGKVTANLKALDKIVAAGVVGGGTDGKPKQDATINSVEVN